MIGVFSIACMPHLYSNIPSNTFYASTYSEILSFFQNYLGHKYSCNTFQSSFKENAETRKQK